MKVKRTTKAQWLEKSLEFLDKYGIESLSVNRLAKAMGTSRSSFYWHFNNRDDLVTQLLDYWSHEYTSIVTDNNALKDLDVESRMGETVKMIRKFRLAKYDLAMHSLAKMNPHAQEVVDSVMGKRLAYITHLLKDLGFSGDDLEVRAHLFVCYYSCESFVFGSSSYSLDNDLNKRLIDFLKHR